ncbi:MAG: caspase family protein [Rhizobiaceae bacterium]
MAAFVVALLALAGMARAERRVALVVGNNAYRHAPVLANPINDATDVAVALENIGFEVLTATDVDLIGLQNTIREFASMARGADVSLFYYSGHGMQWEGENVLVPVDATFADADIVPFEVMPLTRVMNALSLASRARILILDACRDNDAERALKIALAEKRGQRSTNVDRGLVRLNATRGQVVVFATQPDRTASDAFGDASRNSPFTHALLQTIAEPGVEIGRTFRKVAARVDELTGGAQLPEISISLLGDFYFVPGARPHDTDTTDDVASDFAFAERLNTDAGWAAFIAKHEAGGDPFRISLAREARRKLALASPDPVVAPTAACTHSDTILKFADYIIKNREAAGPFAKRRFGDIAAYLALRYANPSRAGGMELLRPLLDANVTGVDDLAVAYALSSGDVDTALRLADPDPLRAFAKIGVSGWRAIILKDGGRTFLDLIERSNKADPPDPHFSAVYNRGLTVAYRIVDQSDDFKTGFATLAEQQGELLLAASVLATGSDLEAYRSFLRRHQDDKLLNDLMAPRELAKYGLTMFHDAGPQFDDADDEETRNLRRQLYKVTLAAFKGGDRDFLNIYVNQTGLLAKAEEIADGYLTEVASRNINPDRYPEEAWMFLYRRIVESVGRAEAEKQLGSFTFSTDRHYTGSVVDVIKWPIAVKALTPYLLWLKTDLPARPGLLGAEFPWQEWTRIAEEIRSNRFDPKAVANEQSARIAIELLFVTSRFDSLFSHVNASFDMRNRLSIYRDLMIRLDRRCGAYTVFPGQALMLAGMPIFRFPQGG